MRIGVSHYHTTCTSNIPKSLSIPDPHPLSSCFSFILRVKLQVVFFIIIKNLKFFFKKPITTTADPLGVMVSPQTITVRGRVYI